jgi:hypothetical protein
MKAPTDRLHRAELLRAYSIYDSREESLLEALAREDGQASAEALERVARLTPSALAFAALSLANVSNARYCRHPFVELLNVDWAALRSFSLGRDMQIKLTATGWQVVRIMGYGCPALIVPESHSFAPIIADMADPEAHRDRVQHEHPLTHWNLQPALPFHQS